MTAPNRDEGPSTVRRRVVGETFWILVSVVAAVSLGMTIQRDYLTPRAATVVVLQTPAACLQALDDADADRTILAGDYRAGKRAIYSGLRSDRRRVLAAWAHFAAWEPTRFRSEAADCRTAVGRDAH